MPKKSRRVTRKKNMKGGYYSFNGSLATGAPNWGSGSEMGEFALSRVGNNALYGGSRRRRHRRRGGAETKEEAAQTVIPTTPGMGGRRRRSRKHTRKMRGGGKYGAVAASYTGTGSRGMADYVQTNTKYPPFGGPEGGAFNNAGAQPGSGFGSFIRMGP
jgi:hypothetical protein